MEQYLRSTDIIDWQQPKVFQQAHAIAADRTNKIEIIKHCFEWVRDNIKHSFDYKMNPVTCSASEVLLAGTGYCYAKSHLLAALLRANNIPAGLCYQRLSFDEKGAPFCLHGLVAVFLPDTGWYRIDPRGNKSGVDAQFTPPHERLAFKVVLPGEADLPEIWPDPLEIVVKTLRAYNTWQAISEHLPDIEV